jgi:hypothetical protein
VSAEAEFAVFRDGFEIEYAREFVVEHEVAHVNRGVDDWGSESAGTLQSKVGASFDE